MSYDPIIKTQAGYIDFQHEREICCRWLNSCGFPVSPYDYGNSKGFYFIHKGDKKKKAYICCNKNLGNIKLGKFWFGIPKSHIRGNADMGVIFIFVWENGTREYMILNNKETLRWRDLWYNNLNIYHIDFHVKKGKYNMLTNLDMNFDYAHRLNDIQHLFE